MEDFPITSLTKRDQATYLSLIGNTVINEFTHDAAKSIALANNGYVIHSAATGNEIKGFEQLINAGTVMASTFTGAIHYRVKR